MTLVKICGITTVDDAWLAARLGADILGFNFYTLSPRYVAPDVASEIVRELNGGVRSVGVFVNEPVDDLLRTANKTGVGAVQLHGNETANYVKDLRRSTELKIIKAFRISTGFEIGVIGEYDVDAVLLDAFSAEIYGGSGRVCDWAKAGQAAAKYPEVYLAGGLRPENVSAAIESVRPFAVDVASGVESANGRKDPDKVARFIRNVKNL